VIGDEMFFEREFTTCQCNDDNDEQLDENCDEEFNNWEAFESTESFSQLKELAVLSFIDASSGRSKSAGHDRHARVLRPRLARSNLVRARMSLLTAETSSPHCLRL
jgi:hypothetical protein